MERIKIWVDREVAQQRFDICKECDQLMTPGYVCRQCLCVMKIKVKMVNSSCPLEKWGPDNTADNQPS